MAMELHEVKRSPEEAGALLGSLEGRWTGTNTTTFEPGTEPMVDPVRGTIRALPGSRFMIYEYQSRLQGEDFQGIALIGFNVLSGQFEFAWADSFHMSTNTMFASGPGLERGFSVLGSYQMDLEQPAWGWRTQFELVDADHLRISMFNVDPEGTEYPGIMTEYEREG